MISPTLIPLTSVVAPAELLALAPAGLIYACDFNVTGAQSFEARPWGYERDRIVNVDHHADTPAMRRAVSSTNLALVRVAACGVAREGETVVINHTDCDSVLSAALLCGDIAPGDADWGEAAIAADHSGAPNAIADLLQALDNRRDYAYSLESLRRLLAGEALDDTAQTELDKRLLQRERAAALVAGGGFTLSDGVAWAVTSEPIFGELLPPLLPDAQVILVFSPRAGEPGRWDNKARIGNAAPANFPLTRALQSVDDGYGGRWNAGSNKRGGGSALAPDVYAEGVSAFVKAF